MSNWRHTIVDSAEFWISCQLLAFLSIFSRWQLIQNSVSYIIMWRQCDIRIDSSPNDICTLNQKWIDNMKLKKAPHLENIFFIWKMWCSYDGLTTVTFFLNFVLRKIQYGKYLYVRWPTIYNSFYSLSQVLEWNCDTIDLCCNPTKYMRQTPHKLTHSSYLQSNTYRAALKMRY